MAKNLRPHWSISSDDNEAMGGLWSGVLWQTLVQFSGGHLKTIVIEDNETEDDEDDDNLSLKTFLNLINKINIFVSFYSKPNYKQITRLNEYLPYGK